MELEIDKCRSITQIKHLSDAELVAQIVKSHNAFNKKYRAKNSEVKKRLTKNDFKDKGRKDLWKEYLVFRANKKKLIDNIKFEQDEHENQYASMIKEDKKRDKRQMLFVASYFILMVICGFTAGDPIAWTYFFTEPQSGLWTLILFISWPIGMFGFFCNCRVYFQFSKW